jgi:outer membrane protein TolC
MKRLPIRVSARTLALALVIAPPPSRADELPPLDLAALLEQAERSSPEILVARARLQASEHVSSQMEALPDPEATVSYTNDSLSAFTLGDSPDSELTLGWKQEVPYPGKRGLAGDVARGEVEVLTGTLDAARWRVRAGVKAVYADLLRVERTTSILGESRELLLAFQESARARYESGDGILENILRAQTEVAKLDAEIATLAQERRSLEVRLLGLLGQAADAPLGPAVAVPRAETPDRAAIEAVALARSPEIRTLQSAAVREERRVDLAQRSLKPDFIWSAAYTNRGDLDPMVMGMFGLRLPVYRKQKQAEAVVEAQYGLDAAQREIEARRVVILAEIRDLLAQAGRADVLLRLYAESILPQARSTLDAAAASYGAGRTEFITLIDDFLMVLTYEVSAETQRAEKVKALAAAEPLVGTDLVLPATEESADAVPGGSHG